MLIPKPDTSTTEIDVIMLHQTGVYIFESKNYSGWIYGAQTQRQWTQTLKGGNKSIKNHFLNPIIQNKGHIKWLKVFAPELETLPLYSYIVFSERCTLKQISLTSGQHEVIKRDGLYTAIQNQVSRAEKSLTYSQIDQLYHQLRPLTQVDEAVQFAHIQNIEQRYDRQNREPFKPAPDEPSRVCPRCGADLVLRKARWGAHTGERFWGCAQYPHCRFTEWLKRCPSKTPDGDLEKGEA